MKIYWIFFGVFGFLAVALGAFAAHGLKSVLDQKYLEIFETGVRYQFYHTLALGLVLLLWQSRAIGALSYAAFFFVLGVVIFCGSLYVLALTRISFLGAITPVGGICFLIGWGFVLYSGIRFSVPLGK